MDQKMPLTPGLEWVKKGCNFKKRVLMPGVSFPQIQWLNYVQSTLPTKLEHAYNQGEFVFEGQKVDGYALINGQHNFYEFLGCQWHPKCPYKCRNTADEQADAEKRHQIWKRKEQFLKEHGKLHVMRECQWKIQVENMQKNGCPKTQMGRILENDNERSLIEAIRTQSVFGFVQCDVTTDPALIEEMKTTLFPPVIKRADIKDECVSPYMRDQMLQQNRKLEGETVVQTYNGVQLLLLTPLLQLYLQRGMKISNVTKVIQYVPGAAFKPFVEKVVSMRIAATHDGDDAKQLTAKLYGNSCK